ncbi:MAG: hypothetical protein LAT81_16170 [Oceanicaulis sp.]|nr:hypothetical protein [Oceanicaulis sp.]
MTLIRKFWNWLKRQFNSKARNEDIIEKGTKALEKALHEKRRANYELEKQIQKWVQAKTQKKRLSDYHIGEIAGRKFAAELREKQLSLSVINGRIKAHAYLRNPQ